MVSAKTVQIDDGGVISTVRLAAPNVAGLFAAGVPLEQYDTVVPAATSPVIAGMQIQVTRIRTERCDRAGSVDAGRATHRRSGHEHEPTGGRRSGNTRRSGRDLCCGDDQRKETGRLPVANTVVVPARDSVLRVGAKPVPKCRP